MTQGGPKFEALLEYLKETRGFDFTGYKRTSLTRRVDRRMSQIGLADYGEYIDYLEVNPDEFTTLFNTILINVTSFFRDPEAWQFLRTDVLPGVLASKEPDSPIRVWSAGCASGEEAYTAAILLTEMLGPEAFRRRVKIYATDVDEDALATARLTTYTNQQLNGLPPELFQRYFETANGRFQFRKDLRRSVIFGRNDMVQNAPISRIDLLVCRNTLMYFNAETQSRILSRLHFALSPEGVLFLGKAEMLLSHPELFAPVDLNRRIFRKVTRGAPRREAVTESTAQPPPRAPLRGLDALRNEAFMTSPVAQVVVTADGLVALTNLQTEHLFGVSHKDLGRPFRDLDLSYRPAELRGYIEQAQVQRRTARIEDVEFVRAPGESVNLEVEVAPLITTDASLLGVNLIFRDVTVSRRLQNELEHTNQRLEAAYEELQSTNEELETTNEELHSTVEELETTNEELQSTNEELETTNEELQSTNDELHGINDELQVRSAELDQANAFLEAILSSLRAGITVVDHELQVQIWNRHAEDLWGIRRDEAVGQHLLNLDIGLPTDQLRPLVRQVISGATELVNVQLAAVNRRGRTIDLRIICAPLRGESAGPTIGAILIMEKADEITAEEDTG